MRGEFFKKLSEAAGRLREEGGGEALIIHHDEADGLCSAAVTKRALERLGFKTETLCLDKLFPSVVERVHREGGKTIFYADIGAFHARRISKLNESRSLTIILDHHDTEPVSDSTLYNLDPELFGISGEKEASASTAAYFFAKTLSEENADLAHLAVVGSAEIPGAPSGLNKMALEDALKGGLAKLEKSRAGWEIKILAMDPPLSWRRASTLLSVLGSVGYYRGGPEAGLSACLEGFPEGARREALKLEEERREANKKLLGELRSKGLNQLGHVQWFHAGDAFKGMGTKVVGSFCSYLSFQRIVNPVKYLIGMMPVPREVPGFGELEEEYVKASGRAPRRLAALINGGKRPPLSTVLAGACEACGGFGDGHAVAASGIILKGREEEFLLKLDSLIGAGRAGP